MCLAVKEIGRVRIVSEQPFIQGTSPSQEEISNEFTAMHFVMKPHRFGDYWFRAEDKLIAFDVEPGNLVLTPNGIVPIDVILQTQD